MYQPFLISGFKTAKSIGREAWLSPPDAFRVLENMIVNKGVLEKRLGFSLFAQMKHFKTLQETTAITGIHTFLHKSMPCLLIMDSKEGAGDGVYTGHCNFYNPYDGSMTDIGESLAMPVSIFTGSPYDFFSFINWQGVGYMVNNVDQIHKWEGRGNAVVPFDIKIDADDPLANQINTCRFMFLKDQRMILLDTVELGEWCPRRCRYSPVLQTDFSAAGGGYVDAKETEERICAAGYIGNNIAVFTQGGDSGTLWLIKSTGNADIPFKWDRMTTTELVRSPYSGVELKDGLAAVGATNIVFYDGFKIKDMDIPHIRDVLEEFNDVFIRSVFGYRQVNERHLLFTFADKDLSNINRILDYNIDENNWTVHKSEQSFFINCIGGSTGQKVPIGAEYATVLAADLALISDMTLDARTIYGTPKPFTLIGCRNSRVYKWLDGEYDGTDDANGEIAIKAESIDLNPFVDKGLKVACEKIGFLVDNDSSASFFVSVHKSTAPAPYKSKEISCDGSGAKFWSWIYCDGEIGNFHNFNISHKAKGNTPKIHAMMPYFEPAGRLDL